MDVMGANDDAQTNVNDVSPDPAPTPSVTPEPEPVAPEPIPDPAISETVMIPADADAAGGEWELLKDKLQSWVNTDQLRNQWIQLKGPLRLLGGLIVLIIVLQVYGGILRTIEALPLASGLLELAGVIWIANFSIRNLVRTSDRRKVVGDLAARWQRVVGH